MKEKWTITKVLGVIYPPVLYYGILVGIQIVCSMFVSSFSTVVYFDKMQAMSDIEFLKMIEECLMGQILLLNVIGQLIAIPLFIFLFWYDNMKQKLKPTYIKYKETRYWTYLMIVPLAVATMLSGNCLVTIVENFMPNWMRADYGEAAEILYSGGILIQIIGSAICAPIIEELIFRGLIYKRIERISGFWPAIIISSIGFGLFHGNAVQAIYGSLMGFALAFVYYKYKSIIAPIILHGVANLISVVSMAFASKEDIMESVNKTYTTEELIALGRMAIVMAVIGVAFMVLIYFLEKPVAIKNTNYEE